VFFMGFLQQVDTNGSIHSDKVGHARVKTNFHSSASRSPRAILPKPSPVVAYTENESARGYLSARMLRFISGWVGVGGASNTYSNLAACRA
jgi:hypothetical protein